MKKYCLMIIALLSLMLCACAVKISQPANYVLTNSQEPSLKPARTSYVLLVSDMTANPGFASKKMIYMKQTSHLGEFAQNQWVAPPSDMLTSLVVSAIDSKRFFKAVVMPPFAGNADFRLSTRLIVLQQEFTSNISEVRCIVQAVLINTRTNQVIASRQFQALIPAPGNNPQSGVSAANQAAELITHQLADFVVASSSR